MQAGHPVTGVWTASTTGTMTRGFVFDAAPAKGTAGFRATGVIGSWGNGYYYSPYVYTYATLRNSYGSFGASNGPGSFSLSYSSSDTTLRVTPGPNKFGGTMRMLSALTTKSCLFTNGICFVGENDYRYDAIGAPAYTSMGYVVAGYYATNLAYYYQSALMLVTTISVSGVRFPWTTGSVTVVANYEHGPFRTIQYANGFDNRTSGGLGTIQLVTPVRTSWFSAVLDWQNAGIGILRLKFISPPSEPTTDVILQPVNVSTDMGTTFGDLFNVVNQSGLSSTYLNNVTNFDAYIASTPTHSNAVDGNFWTSQSGTTTGNVDFDLGGTFFLQSFALWNYGDNNDINITGITLLADHDASFSSPTVLGSFTPNPNMGPFVSVDPEVFSFTITSASHVRMQITSNNGDPLLTAFGETAFEMAGDLDGDGIPNAYETNTGTYVSPTDTGSDPNDADSDDDGLNDGAEVELGTDPNNEDSDGDLVCDGGMQVGTCTAAGPDNCPFVANFSQANGDSLAAGDECQCGNVDGIDGVTSADVARVQENLLGLPLGGPFDATYCNVIGASDGGVSDCDIADIFALKRFLTGFPVPIADSCAGYGAP